LIKLGAKYAGMQFTEISRSLNPPVELIKDPSPDHLIRAVTDGIIATSDSTNIDNTGLLIFDLPYFVLHHIFHHDFPSLEELSVQLEFNR